MLISKLEKHIKIGDPSNLEVNLGPLYSESGVKILKEQIKKTLDMGGKVVFGSLDWKMDKPELANGYYFYPMIIENIPKGSPAYKEELFGPVFSLFKFKDEKDGIDLANDHIYGLGASIFTQNIQKAK
jgi:succinate-semialdehyde dehydrogenase/glutarate-semialdehyde dehydrogenase